MISHKSRQIEEFPDPIRNTINPNLLKIEPSKPDVTPEKEVLP
jgi:hypothetical protein